MRNVGERGAQKLWKGPVHPWRSAPMPGVVRGGEWLCPCSPMGPSLVVTAPAVQWLGRLGALASTFKIWLNVPLVLVNKALVAINLIAEGLLSARCGPHIGVTEPSRWVAAGAVDG